MSEHLKYPIGRFRRPETFDHALIAECISIISEFPAKLKDVASALNDTQLDTPYREGGWTIRQVVHHCADSHINSFVRFKLALTEDKPIIKAYKEANWAELPDAHSLPIESSIKILEGLHFRWHTLLKNLDRSDLDLVFVHPEHGREIALKEAIALYAWHCRHHLAHIVSLKERLNWS